MDAPHIIEIIKQHRDDFWDRQTIGCESDDPVYSEPELARLMADEYDRLLIQIGAITPSEAKSA